MEMEIGILLNSIKSDYVISMHGNGEISDIRKNMIDEFVNSVDVKFGKKYAKIVIRNSVWGFVVIVADDKKFKYGDILLPAGFNGPSRNFARGNIFDMNYNVRWTGPI